MSLKTFFPYFVFQLTTSRRGRLRQIQNLQQSFPFQLTTSRRGRRLLLFCQPNPLMSFQLTTSRRGRPRYFLLCTINFYFNSRPHEEVDLQHTPFRIAICNFNSRPHEEVDLIFHITPPFFIISTHDLTKRSTRCLLYTSSIERFQLTTSRRGRLHPFYDSFDQGSISTHDLTKRSTSQGSGVFGHLEISTHDLTKRSTLRRRLRPYLCIISTHDLTKRSTSRNP